MKIITANLKLLYQNRELWAWYLIAGISIFYIISSLPAQPSSADFDPSHDWYLLSPILVLAIIGCAMGRLTASIWTKPLFFNLPGQTKKSRELLFLIGLAAAAITTVIMTAILSWITFSSFSVMISSFSFYLMIYSLSLIISIRFNKSVFVIPYFLLFITPLLNNLDILYFVQSQLLAHPWASAFICWIFILMISNTIGSKHLFRSLCGAPSLIFFVGRENPGSDGRIYEIQKKDSHGERFSGTVNRLFFQNIQSNNRSSVSPQLRTRIYVILGSFISNWRIIFFDGPIIFLSVAILINSSRSVELQSFLYSFIALMGGHICLISESNIFLPVDRRQRFFREITALITGIFVMLILVAAFNILSKILPNSLTSFISLYGPTEVNSMHRIYIFFTIILFPITGGLLILFKKRSYLSILSITGIATFLLGFYYHLINNMGYTLLNFNLFIVILSIVISFGFFLSVIYYNSFKRSFS